MQADFLNGMIDDTILVQVTSKRHGIPGTEVALDPAVETGSGLLHLSYAFSPNLLTVDPADVDQSIGTLSDQAMQRIEACLKTTLGIR